MTRNSEAIEREALADLHAAATPELVAALRLKAAPVGAALVSIAGALRPSATTINRALGVGLSAPETEGTISRLLDAYRDAAVSRYFVQCHPEARPPALVGWLLAAGLEKARGWQKFRRGRERVVRADTDLRVEAIGPGHGAAFGRLVADALGLGEAAAAWLACLAGRPGWHVFMSFDRNEPAGAGALYVRDGLAWADYGVTAPAHRGRGSEPALLARRIERALELGCREIFTCTREHAPGDPQASYKHVLEAGFEEDYVRDNYAPPAR